VVVYSSGGCSGGGCDGGVRGAASGFRDGIGFGFGGGDRGSFCLAGVSGRGIGGRLRVRFPILSLEFYIDIIFLASL
jgi:hypothetical protein